MVNKEKIPSIILDCDLRSQEGIIQSIGNKNVPIIGLSSKKNCPAFNSKFVNKKIITPDINDDPEDYVNFLCNMSEKGVLIYSNDVSAVTLSRYKDRLLNAGFLLNISESDIVEKLFDKYLCFQTAVSLGVPFPKSQVVASLQEALEAWDDFRKPVIIKGTRMAGGSYIKIDSKDDLKRAFHDVERKVFSRDYSSRESGIMLQEWLNYSMTDIWHCETVYSISSTPMGFFIIKNIRSSFLENGNYGSRVYAGEHIHSNKLVELTKRLLSSVNWQGFANIDYVYVPDHNEFYLLDVNPRLPGFSYYPSKAGYEMAWYYYCDLTGNEFTIPNSFPKSLYFESFRYPGDITDGVRYIAKGYISSKTFVLSYAKSIFSRNKVVIEPVKCDDLKYTVMVQIYNIQSFLVHCFLYIKRKFRNVF